MAAFTLGDSNHGNIPPPPSQYNGDNGSRLVCSPGLAHFAYLIWPAGLLAEKIPSGEAAIG